MLRNQEICNFLNDNLSGEHTFKIFSEIGRSKDDGAIHGVLTRNSPQMTPLSDVIVNDYNFTIELSIPAQLGNKYLESIEKTINDFAKEWNGKEYAFKDGKGTLHFNLTSTGNFNTSSRVGNQVPLVFGLTIVYTEDVVTSLNKHWLLDGVEIPFISEDVMLEKEGITKPIQGKQYKETLLTGQTKFYHFRMYFKEGLATTLHQDILQGDFEKTYKLEYYDGVSFTQENKFETTVSIFRSANANSEKPRASVLDIIFSDVEEFKDGTIYEFGLFDDDFDVQSENTRYFNSQEEQRDYYNEKVKNGAEFQRIKAPNLDSIVITNQVYRNINNYDLFNLTNKNKAVIRVGTKTGNNVEYHKYFYYDVSNPVIGAKNQVAYDLKIDSVQTYCINENIEFDGSFIQKAHLNRWIDNGDGTISFNGKADSKLFEREEIKEVAKRLVSRAKLQMYTSKNTELCDWLNDYVDAWVYVVIDAGHRYKTKDSEAFKIDSTRFFRDIYSDEGYDYSTACVCFPLYKYIQAQIRFASNTASGEIKHWSEHALISFLNNNSNYSYVKCVKISLKPPFDLNSETIKYTIDTETILDATLQYLTLTTSSTNVTGLYSLSDIKINNTWFSPATGDGLLIYDKDYLNPIKLKTTLTIPNNTFNKDNVTGVGGVGVNKNKKFNPKLNASDYKSLVLTFAGSTYEMDLQKINQDSVIEFEYIEMITADITKGLCRFKSSSNNDIFSLDYSKSFNGFIFTNDLSLPIANGQLDSYLANNKNAYLSFQNQQTLASTQYAIRSANNITNLVKDPVNLINGTQNILTDTVSTAVNIAYTQAQFDLSIDNMRNAPQTLMNANGNVSFVSAVAEFGVYAELYEGLDTELEMANDFMVRDGFTYNRFDNIKIYNKIRKYFNYIKANIGTITGVAISNPIRADIRNRFANGIRFWKPINGEYKVDYSKENYEEWIDTNFKSFEEWLEKQ